MEASTHVVQGVCPHDCPDTCALQITVDGGRAVRIQGAREHPPTQGVLCTKVSRYLERTYHRDRLTQPLVRVGPKGSGHFAPIGWDAALTLAARRLGEIAARDPQGILPYSYGGTLGLVQGEGMAARFFHRLGASRLDRTICAAAGRAAMKHTYGGSVGMHAEFFDESRLILIWGSNPVSSNLHLWTRAQEAKRRGATLVAIDPYRSQTAEKCDRHIALRPGTDAALALGLAHVLIVEDLIDHDYVERFTLGYEALRARALAYPPERVARICGLDAQVIVDLAREYAATRPAAIRVNYGLQRTRNGGDAVRAIACLPALVGAWRDRAGGLLLSTSGFAPVDNDALRRPDLTPGWPAHPPREINMSALGDALLHPGDATFGPRIDAIVVYNANPAAVAPDSAKVAAGFAREDLFTIVMDHFQTDSADWADLVLPATTQLEHFDVHKAYGHTHIQVNWPAIAPVGQARPNSAIFRGLAAALGFTDSCLFESDEAIGAQAFDWDAPALAHGSWAQLLERGWLKLDLPEAPFAEGGFPTKSGRCEFHAADLARAGADPVPDYVPPFESAEHAPALAARYPLALLSTPARHFLNSTFVNVDSLRGERLPSLEMHPRDAACRALADGDLVRVFNERGHVSIPLHVTERVREGVVVGPSVWWKKLSPGGLNLNQLTSQALSDLGASATFYDCLVEVRAA